jgi:hypothetical protein
MIPRFLVALLVLVFIANLSFGQTKEQDPIVTTFPAIHPAMQAWEDYFEENYFSKGIPFDSVCREGTGYLPYLRERHFYDLRRDYRGEVDLTRRWDVFEKMRHATLDRSGLAPAADWQSLGPNMMEGQGGRMISHAFEPGNSQGIWAGSASGGLWLTENGGDSWQPMTDQIPSTGIGAVAVNPLNPNSLLIGTGEGFGQDYYFTRPGIGVFKSSDRGLFWQPTDFDYPSLARVSAFKIAWSHADTNSVWLGATNGIWKSTDAGLSWSLKLGDGTNQQNFICSDIVQHPDSPDTLYAAITWSGVWRSTDGGENWSKLTGGLPTTDIHFIKISLCQSQPNVLYAAMAGAQPSNFGLKGLYRTNDGGETWVKIQNAPNAFCQPANPTACQGWYDNIVAVSPADPELVWLGGVTLWRSQNGGQNWTQHDRLICPNCTEPPTCRTYVDQHDFAFDPENPSTLYVFNDGGVAKSTDGGNCWQHKNTGLMAGQLNSIASGRSDPGTIISGTQDHGLQGIKLSENTGLAWDRWDFYDGTDVEVHGSNANILFGGWINGTYRRTNGGVHTLASQITNGINLSENNGGYWATLAKHPQNHLTLLGATRQKLYKSVNGGVLWMPVATIAGPYVFEFDQADPNFAYAAAWNNSGAFSFWKSENGGDTWAQTANAPGWRVTSLKSSPLQAGLLYACRNSINANQPHVFKSEDFGDTWTPIQGDLPDLPVSAVAVHHFVPGVVFAATDLGVFITCDDGTTWTEYNDNLPVSFATDIEFNPVDTTLRISTYGRGAWLTKAWMPEPSATGEVSNSRGFGFANISPNPASEQVRISFFLEKTADVRLEIVNVLGQKVATLFSGKQAAGNHEAIWNGLMVNGWRAQTGVYFVRLAVGNKGVTGRVVWR